MNWIKTNYDQLILGLVALLLLALSGIIIMQARSFQDTFASIRGQVFENKNVPAIDTSNLKDALNKVKAPSSWVLSSSVGSLFVSIPYIDLNGDLVSPDDPKSKSLHDPVPNKWIIDNKLDIIDNNVLNEDPDGDGFSNLDEYMGTKNDGSDSTNPNDKSSHPPYYTKLRLIQYIKQPFRLLFESYDGTPAKPDEMTFQINAMDAGAKTQFPKIGDMIEGTKFKIIKFEPKSQTNAATGEQTDVSELTVQNTEDGENVVLILNQVANSPDSYADFQYLWNNTEFKVKKAKQFALLPDTNSRYILIDITEDSALIQTPDKQKVTVPKLKQ